MPSNGRPLEEEEEEEYCTTFSTKSTVFRVVVVMPFSSKTAQRFGETYSIHLQGLSGREAINEQKQLAS
jgi:hypothetical protein